jgi:hypothetical protein
MVTWGCQPHNHMPNSLSKRQYQTNGSDTLLVVPVANVRSVIRKGKIVANVPELLRYAYIS